MATHRLDFDATKPWDEKLPADVLRQVPGVPGDVVERVVTMETEVVHETGMRHRATADRFVFHADEPAAIGGDELDPYPLDYMVASVAFCVVTQVVRCARVLKIDVDDVRCRVRMHWSQGGSVKAGTNAVACHAMETTIEIDSPAPRGAVENLLRRAEANCFARAAVEQPVVVTTTATHNGATVELSPARTP